MNHFTAHPLFGLALCILAYWAGVWLHKQLKITIANPLLIAIAITIMVLKIVNVPVENFEVGGSVLGIFLLPATACLGVTIYQQRRTIAAHILPILAGCLAGAMASIASVLLLGKWLGLSDVLIYSSLPKSATTPIAIEITRLLGGDASITAVLVLITGIAGAVLAPLFIRLFRLKSPIATGVAMGSASHAIGTSLAIKLGTKQGAASSISIVATGLFLFALLFLCSRFGLI